MQIRNSVPFVTGANRGLGAQLVQQLLDGGASKVYAGARDITAVQAGWAQDPRVELVAVDVTDQSTVDAAARHATDVDLLINNAGTLTFNGALEGDLDAYRRDLEINYFGAIRVSRAFAPALQQRPKAAIVNIVTIIALAPARGMVGYSASKAATHVFTQALRAELHGTGVEVLAAYPAQIDSDMLEGVEADKTSPVIVAERVLAGVEAGEAMIWPDDSSAYLGGVYAAEPARLEAIISGTA